MIHPLQEAPPARAGEVIPLRETLVSYDPATGARLGEVPAVDKAGVIQAVARARLAQPAWSATPLRDRRRLVRQLNHVLRSRIDAVAELLCRENGKPRTEALITELLPVVLENRFLIHQAQRILRPRKIRMPLWNLAGKQSRLLRQPWGVVGIITPWNFPFAIPVTQVATALIAGNCVVLKPSSSTPLVSETIRDVFDEAGFPDGVFTLVQAPGKVAEALVEADVDFLVFTGSVETGRHLHELAAHRLIPVTLELGGKDAALVLNDANLKTAAAGIVWGAFANAGQTCASIERVYAEPEIFDRLRERIVAETRRLRQGIDRDFEIDVGTMTTADQAAKVRAQLQDAVARGATVLTGFGLLPPGQGRVIEPTVLTGVTEDMAVMSEEIFGPVLPLIRAASMDNAVEAVNRSPYGLGASIWTRDLRRGHALAERLNVGTVTVNDCLWTYAAAETPWGGVRWSGRGRSHGAEGLLEMTRPLHVAIDRLPGLRKPWWFPYHRWKYRVLKRSIAALAR